MIAQAESDNVVFQTTDGEIAAINLNSARLRSWTRFDQDPQRTGVSETVLEHEQLTAQLLGDLSAFDRMETLADLLARLDPSSPRTALIRAQVASALHRFAEARGHVAQASLGEASAAENLLLTIDQACGTALDAVLEKRRRIAEQSGLLPDQVALGALLADLGDFAGADQIYRQALRDYREVSPFPVAWACFQLGVLWGELVPEPDLARAERWYRKAVACLPCYVKARVHLAEIQAGDGRTREAEATLVPAIASGDPEVLWRLADTLAVSDERRSEADAYLDAARSGFEALLARHLLAFADHGAEFYAGSGGDARRAFELSRINLENRPTLRAFEQAHETAIGAGETEAAAAIAASARRRWAPTAAFRLSSLARHGAAETDGAVA